MDTTHRFEPPLWIAAFVLSLFASSALTAPVTVSRPSAQGVATNEALPDLTLKEPYLIFDGDGTHMQVLWQLYATDTCRIEWGSDTTYSLGSAPTAEYGASHQHSFTFTGLTPGARYFYRETNEGVPHRGSFVAAPPAGATALKFFAYGDTRSNPTAHDQVCQGMISALVADPEYQTVAVVVGDLVLNGALETDWTSQFFSPVYPNIRKLLASMPYQSCRGNHEGNGVLFKKYFPYSTAGAFYGSFDYGPAHFTYIDQYDAISPGSTQYAWLVNDLASTTRMWKFVVLHEPGWSALGGHANNTVVQTVLEPLFAHYGVSIVFGGHNHYYARAEVDGIEHLTVGGGGAPLADPYSGAPYVVSTAKAYHFSKVAIDGATLRFQALRPDGTLLDSFELHAPVDVTTPAVAVTAPAGGATWKAGSTHSIEWIATDSVGVAAVDLDYSTDGGASYPHSIAAGLANSGAFVWTVPDTPTDFARVRATARDAAGNAGLAESADFTIDRWIIQASAGPGGSISPAGEVPVVEGTSAEFAVTPAAHHHIADVVVDGASIGPVASYTFTNVVAHHSIAAEFALDTHTLAVALDGSGTVTRSPDLARYDYGAVLTLIAIPATGWRFAAWSGDASSGAATIEVTVDGDKSVTATFTMVVTFDLKPHDVDLASKGKWLTGYLRLPPPYLASQVDVASVRLNGVVPPAPEHPAKIEDHDTRLKMKFARTDVIPTLTAGRDMPVTLTGRVAGAAFSGTDLIKVKAAKIHTPPAGSTVIAGSVVRVTWELPDVASAQPVSLRLSLDGGLTWSVVADSLPNTGACDWSVPQVATGDARLEALTVFEVDETGAVAESECAMSDGFTIAAATGVADGAPVLALRPANPARGGGAVSYSLTGSGAATLLAYDVGGRRVLALEVGTLGPGWHVARLGALPSGLYVLRLSEAGRSVTARVVVIP